MQPEDRLGAAADAAPVGEAAARESVSVGWLEGCFGAALERRPVMIVDGPTYTRRASVVIGRSRDGRRGLTRRRWLRLCGSVRLSADRLSRVLAGRIFSFSDCVLVGTVV